MTSSLDPILTIAACGGLVSYITMAIRDRRNHEGRVEVADLWVASKDHAVDYLMVQKLTRKGAEAYHGRWMEGVRMASEGRPQTARHDPEDALDDSLEGLF